MNDDEDEVPEEAPKVKEPKQVEERPFRRSVVKRSSPKSFDKPVLQPAPASRGALRVRILTLRNRSGALLFLPVLNGDGTKKQLRMGANATVQIPEDQLTDYARRLLSRGQVSIDPHR